MAHFAFRVVDRLVVVVQDTQAPTDVEWKSYLEACAELVRQEGSFQGGSALIFTDGGIPNGSQRVALTRLLRGQSATSAVVTDALLVRAGLGVLSMLNPALKVFPSSEWGKAASFARVEEGRRLEILKVAVALGREVGDPKVLRAIGL